MMRPQISTPLERSKQHLLALLYANTCILYCHIQHDMTCILLFHLDVKGDTSFFCIFHSVCQNIRNYLTNPHLIPIKLIWNMLVDIQNKLQTFFLRPWLYHQKNIIKQPAQLIFFRHKLHLSRLDLGNIQNIIDQ